MLLNTTIQSQFNFTNSTELHDAEIGGILYFLTYLAEFLPYTLLSAFGTVIGILGNILIIGAVICSKELHTTTNILVFNLALADIVISSLVDSFTVVGVLIGKKFFDDRPFLCHLIAAICLIACETSLMNIGFLAINRYVNICHHRIYEKMFNTSKTILYCVITWIIGLSIDIPNVTGWGGHYYDLKTLNCVWDRLASHSYSIFFPMSSIVIPCVCIGGCYLRIFIFVRQSKTKVIPTSKNSKLKSKDLKKSIRIAKGLFASFMLFTVCWLPYGIVVMVDYKDNLPRTAHMFTMSIAHLNSSLNPILYAVFNPGFQRGYKNFFRVLFMRKRIEFAEKTQVSKVSDTH